jgi:hypothetical protein
MNRRRFFGRAIAAGIAWPTLVDTANAQDLDWSAVDYDAVLDEVLSEMEAVTNEKLEMIGGADFVADYRSVLDLKKMKADFPAPPLDPGRIAEIRSRKYSAIPVADRPSHSWPAADRAPDYSHLGVLPLKSPAFMLSAGVLRLLAERNGFDLAKTSRPVIVFGLRGCRIADNEPFHPWAEEHALEAGSPGHLRSSCVLGLWRTADDYITVYRASTVPAVAHMYMSLAERGVGTSLLPTGLYDYSAGTHLADKPKSIQRGALCIASGYVVMRTAKDLSYDPYADTTAWTRGEAHNIHAGGTADLFSCAGCQVVPGGYSGEGRQTATGPWSTFQTAAGLVGADGTFVANDTKPSFLYMLLTGQDAALAFHGGSAFNNGYYRLRPGSSGPDVADLQKRLIENNPGAVPGLSASGSFDLRTTFAVLIDHEKQTGEYTTPVVSI